MTRKRGKAAIKHNEANMVGWTSVRKSLRVIKARRADIDRKEQMKEVIAMT